MGNEIETPADVLQRLGDDAEKWAAEFRETAIRIGYSDMDEGWLIGWFANAIEHSGDVRRWRKEAATLRQQAGRVDEGMVKLAAAAIRAVADNQLISDVACVEFAYQALTAALAQNTQGDGEPVAGIQVPREGLPKQAQFIPYPAWLKLPPGVHDLYLHAERARVPDLTNWQRHYSVSEPAMQSLRSALQLAAAPSQPEDAA